MESVHPPRGWTGSTPMRTSPQEGYEMINGALAQTQRLPGQPVKPSSARKEPADEQLVDRFVRHNDQAAFKALVDRHGPMIFGVCRRILGDVNEAEDAFQATFLVLIRKAGSIRRPELVGNWLYGVACRIARKATAQPAHRRAGAESLSAAASPSVLAMAGPELMRRPPTGWTRPVLVLTVLTAIILGGFVGYRAVAGPVSVHGDESAASCHVGLTIGDDQAKLPGANRAGSDR